MEHAAAVVISTIYRMSDRVLESIPNMVIAVIIFSVTCVCARINVLLTAKVSRRTRLDVTLAHALRTLVNVSTFVLGCLVAACAVIPDFSLAHVIAGLGIYSVAIGFAFNSVLQNFFAGLLLLWQKPFRIGDQIKTKEFEGTVEDIAIRATYLRTYSGEKVVIPNGDVFSNPIVVLTDSKSRRTKLTFEITTDKPIAQVKEEIRRVIQSVPEVSETPEPQIVLTDTTSDALKFDIYMWIASRHTASLAVTDQVAEALRDYRLSSAGSRVQTVVKQAS